MAKVVVTIPLSDLQPRDGRGQWLVATVQVLLALTGSVIFVWFVLAVIGVV